MDAMSAQTMSGHSKYGGQNHLSIALVCNREEMLHF